MGVIVRELIWYRAFGDILHLLPFSTDFRSSLLSHKLQVVPDMPPLWGERSTAVGERGATRPRPPEVGLVVIAGDLGPKRAVGAAAVVVMRSIIIATRPRLPRGTLSAAAAAEVEFEATTRDSIPVHRHRHPEPPRSTITATTPNRHEVLLPCPFLQRR